MKKAITLFLVFILCLGLLPQGAWAKSGEGTMSTVEGTCGEDLKWSLTDEGLLTIYGTGKMDDYYTGNYAPWYVYRQQIKEVLIKSGVTYIGSHAFYSCGNVTSVSIADTVSSFGEFAFYYCTSLQSADIPKNVTVLPKGLFCACYALTRVTIPKGVTSIGQYAFNSCQSLSGVTIPDSVTSYGDNAFDGCISLVEVSLPGGAEVSGGMFRECTALERVAIAQGVTAIKGSAFNGCSALNSVILPDSITTIGGSAFMNCSALAAISLPEGVTSIGEHAFSNCSALKDITLPKKLTSLGKYAFSNCKSITRLTIPSGVATIPGQAFFNCSSLNWLLIREGVSKITNSAFSNCTSLTTLILPASITSIEGNAFLYCDSIEDVYYCGTGEEDWNAIDIGYGDNGTLTTAARHYAIFTDVKNPEKFFFFPVYWALDNEITTGVKNADGTYTRFNPNGECTRAEVVTFLYRMAGKPAYEYTKEPFTDAKTDKWYSDGVYWAAANNITTGTSKTTFSPNQACTRGQVVTFLYRAAGSPAVDTSAGNPFTDVKSDKFFYNAVLWAVANDITTGTSGTTFSPNDTCTRGQVVTFLYRYQQYLASQSGL